MDQQQIDNNIATVEQQLSDAQEKALAILPLPSAVLSIIGSTVIIYIACNNSRRDESKWTPYTRLLIMMSVSDMLFSTTIAIGAFLRPSQTSTRAWAFGTAATCSAVGFLNQLATSAVLYNAMLSVYFLLTARFNFRNSFIATTIEPLMHFFSLGYPLLTAIVGAAVGEYGEMTVNGLVCWLVKFPTNCGYGPGESGEECLSKFVGWVFYGLPVLITFVTIITNSVILVLFVQKQSLPPPRSSSKKRGNAIDQSRREHYRRLRLVRTQACLFLASFTVCIFWTGVLNSVESTATTVEEELAVMYRFFPVSVLQAIFMPLQGFLNMFVYIRPKYLKTRQEYPNESKSWAFQRSIFGEDIHPTQIRPLDAKVERVVKKKMSARQKNAMVGAFDSNEVEFYQDDDDDWANNNSSSKKLSSSKKVSKKFMSSLTVTMDDDEDPTDDEPWDTVDNDENDQQDSSTTTIRRQFRSSIIEGSSLEMINEDSESVFEPISTPPLHSRVVSAPLLHPPPPLLNLEDSEGRWSAEGKWNADCSSEITEDTSQSIPPLTPPDITTTSILLPSQSIPPLNNNDTRINDDDEDGSSTSSEEDETHKDLEDDDGSPEDDERPLDSSSSSHNDHPIRPPLRHHLSGGEASVTREEEDPEPQAIIEQNDVPIGAPPARLMSDESLTSVVVEQSPSSYEEHAAATDTSASTSSSPVAASQPTTTLVDSRQAVVVESPGVILPSQRRSRSRLHGPAYYAATRH